MNRDVVGFFLDLPMGILYVVAGWMTNDQSQGVGSTAGGLSCLALPAALSRGGSAGVARVRYTRSQRDLDLLTAAIYRFHRDFARKVAV